MVLPKRKLDKYENHCGTNYLGSISANVLTGERVIVAIYTWLYYAFTPPCLQAYRKRNW